MHIQCHCGNDFYRSLSVFKGSKNRNGVQECYECTGAVFTPNFEDVKQDLENHNIILYETEYINQNTNMNIQYDCGFEAYRNYANIKKSKYKVLPHLFSKYTFPSVCAEIVNFPSVPVEPDKTPVLTSTLDVPTNNEQYAVPDTAS